MYGESPYMARKKIHLQQAEKQITMQNTSAPVRPGINPIIIVGILFFIFGFITWLNSVLIPYLRIACQLNNFQAYLVTTAFYISYLVMAVPASLVLKRFGFKNGMAVGLLVIGAG